MKSKAKILAGALIGMLLLIALAKIINPPLADIASLEENEEQEVRIQGTVTRITGLPKVTFIDIRDASGKITAVIFEPADLAKDELVEVSGKVQVYKGKKELLAERIEKLSALAKE